MDTKKATKAETESLLPEAQSNESEPQNQPQADEKATATEAEPKTASEAKTSAMQAVESESHEVETETQATDTSDTEAKTPTADATKPKEETQEQETAQPILYAGVILVRNKTSKPLCLSPIQLGIYATFTIQSGEIVALPHKYARSLIMQNCFEQVSGTLVFHEAK